MVDRRRREIAAIVTRYGVSVLGRAMFMDFSHADMPRPLSACGRTLVLLISTSKTSRQAYELATRCARKEWQHEIAKHGTCHDL